MEPETRKKDLESVVVLAGILLLLHFVFHKIALVYISFILLVTGLFFGKLTSHLVRALMKFSRIIGRFNSKVILFLFFYLFITPFSFFYRLFSKNPLLLRKDKTTTTYFHTRNYSFKKEDFEKVY